MSGYTRQSAADIIPTATVRAAPINNELNAIRDTFGFDPTGVTGHKHDGSSDEGSYVPLISDLDGNNKVAIDTANNRVGVFTEVSSAPVEQVRIQDGVIVPVTDNDIDLGTSSVEFKNLYLDGTAKIDTLTVDENATVAGTLGVTGLSTLASADINAGTIDGTVIGAASAQAVTGTLITASTGFSGTLTGNVTGNLTGNSAGTHTGPVIGNVTGNITSTGTSSFANVTIDGSLNMNSGTSATVTGLSTPVDPSDAATKNYVDTSISNLIDSAPSTLDTLNELAAALGDDPSFATTITNSIATKLPLAGGTMSGAIAMGTNKVTGLGNPTSAQDAATKTYVDTADALKLSLTGGTMTGNIVMGANKVTSSATPTTDDDLTRKAYVDSILGSATAAATSAAAALVSETNASTSESNAATSETNAAASASNAASSASAASTSASNAATSETNAATSETNAAASETAAATSASNAATSESNASASASAAATSESNAAASASAAATSASNASTSETNAATSASNAAASYDAFDDRYLGSKASAPTLDNDGNALLTGALYWNTGSNILFIWTGSVWSPAALTATDFVLVTGASMTGALSVTAPSEAPAVFNRTTTEGDIVEFQSAGLAAGKIGISDGFYIMGSGGCGLLYDPGGLNLLPFNYSGNDLANGTIALGLPNAKWEIVHTEDVQTGALNINGAIEFPTADGTSGQVLTTDGAGSITFADTYSPELYAENPSSPTAPSATGANAVAIGSNARAASINAIGLGVNSWARSDTTFAVFGDAQPSSTAAISIGLSSVASGAAAAAFGRDSYALASGSVSLGKSRTSGTDSFAAAIANNTSSYGATGSNSVAIGSTAKATGAGSFSIGKNSFASGGDAGIFGVQSIANSTRSYAFGAYANAGHEGKIAFSNQRLASAGDTQAGLIVLRVQTTSDTPAALTTSSGGTPTTQQIILPNNSAYAFHGTIVARQQASAGTACAAWKIEGLIRREGSAGTTVLVNSATTVLDNTPGWGMALSADTTNGGLKIEVTGAAATNIRWVATINTSEVTY